METYAQQQYDQTQLASAAKKAMIFGIIAIATSAAVIGVIFGILALCAYKKAKTLAERYRIPLSKKATIGQILGLVGLILGAVAVVCYIIAIVVSLAWAGANCTQYSSNLLDSVKEFN